MHGPLWALKRPIATLVALTMTLMASLMIGGAATAASGSANTSKGTVAQTALGTLTSKVVGKASDGSKVTGHFNPIAFTKKDGKQQVKGLIEGVVTHSDGTKDTFTALRTMKVKSINGTSLSGLNRSSAQGLVACDILHLVLGPLDLDLLGLVVHLDKVVLDITAVPGAGALLGNLLCAVVGLLDGTGIGGLSGILTNLLNAILGILQA
jgi:hypothetical protein